jgi:diaminopimelate decarboxylase
MSFHYKGSKLYVEDIPAEQLAEKFETPLYVYSQNILHSNYRAFKEAFRSFSATICYALKANSNPALLRLLAKEGSGADIVSIGELRLALGAGIPAEKIVFTGVGKTEKEIIAALQAGVFLLNVESDQELKLTDAIARKLKKKARIGIRVNPDIDPQTHPYISTGLRQHKFGIPMSDAMELYRLARSLKNIEVRGIHMHLGSQMGSAAPMIEGFQMILSFIDKLKKEKIDIEVMDVGGGLSIAYAAGDSQVQAKELAAAFKRYLRNRKLKLILEPGRSIIGKAGILLTRVLYTKCGSDKQFVIVDAGMNDLLRPSLYGAYHGIIPARKTNRKKIIADIVGPVCETGDFLAVDREIAQTTPGEYLAVMDTGAYGYSMSSNYNVRPRPAEVLVSGKRGTLIRKREVLE